MKVLEARKTENLQMHKVQKNEPVSKSFDEHLHDAIHTCTKCKAEGVRTYQNGKCKQCLKPELARMSKFLKEHRYV